MFLLDRLFKKKDIVIDSRNVPGHIAIIMDGNGRWAKKRGLPRSVGHRNGANTLNNIAKYCNRHYNKHGLKYLTVYAFSTENWKRPEVEVNMLMILLLEYLKNAEKHLDGEDVRIRIIGDISRFNDDIISEIARVTNATQNNKGLTLNIALNYGSRPEIVNAVKRISGKIADGSLNVDDISEASITENLYTNFCPDPDLLIRTGGEQRLSNFLLWQAAYSEFWYTDVLWPDFKEENISEAIIAYQDRDRRYGGI